MNVSAPIVRSLQIVCAVTVSLWFTGRQTAWAQPANEPLPDFITTDGLVYTLAKSNDVLYLGGAFGLVGLRTGGGVPVNDSTGLADAAYPKFNGTVSIAIGDSAGGWFVGGTFTLVGSAIHSNLVHIRSDRTVDATWSPMVSGGFVRALWLTNNALYIGGAFTNVNGQTRNRLAALDATSGALQTWDPNANNTVSALAVAGTNVYVGGTFSSVGGQSRNLIAAVDRSSGAVTAWNPGVSGPGGSTPSVNALQISNGRLFVAGYFSTIGGQTRGNLASVDLTTGGIEAWDPNIGTVTILAPTVFTLAVDQSTVYVGGAFSKVGASNRVNVAAVDAITGAASSWDARADMILSSGVPTAQVSGLAVSSNVVYVGGILRNIGGSARGYAAALDTIVGDALPWNPNPNGNVISFCASGNSIFLGGIFGTLGGLPRKNLAAFNLTTKEVTSWNPTADGNVWGLLTFGGQMYIGGEFTNVNNTARSRLASVDINSGALSTWDPSPNSFVLAMVRWQDRLYVAGGFTNIGGVLRTNLAALDLTTGQPTAWDAGITPRGQVRTLALAGNTLYAGGLISTAQGQIRRRIAAFDLTTGLLTPWDPSIATTGASDVEAIEPAGNVVYIGGRFVSVGGQNRTNFVAVDAATAAVLPMTAHTDQPVTGLAATTNQVFIGGNFTIVNGQKRSNLASLSVSTGQLASWNPSPDFFDQRIFIFDNVLYPVGVFLRIGSQTSRGIAAFPLTAGIPAIVTGSARTLSDRSFEFQVYVPGAAQVTVQTSTNLANWQAAQALNLVGGHGTFIDSNTTNNSGRLFRLTLP